VALTRLLAGSGLDFREVGGSFVLFRVPAKRDLGATKKPPALPVLQAIPEILVIGRRTQNADILRTENDIQPYKVSTRREIGRSHRSNIEEFARARVPANAQTRSPAQEVYYRFKQGITRSSIDLRGLGRRSTLVLVDGRRMPSTLGDADFDQPDLNGIPLSAIERIETLTGTAGGIYGPSALGGVVNVVLRRDYTGVDAQATSSVTSRGDAKSLRLEGRVGFTTNDSRTGIMLLAEHRTSEPLLAGQRDFSLRARQRQFANDPVHYVSRRETGNSVGVFSQTGGNLVLDSASGGGSLGAPYTYLPLGFTGTREQAVALLQANAGKIDLELSNDRSGKLESLLANAEVTSGLMNVRHSFSDGVEAFIDGIVFRNRGTFHSGLSTLIFSTAANAPSNPFSQRVFFRYPLPAAETTRRTQESGRLTAGLILALPKGWSASADFAVGFSREEVKEAGSTLSGAYAIAVQTGNPGPDGLPSIDPLGSWADVEAASSLYLQPIESTAAPRSTFKDGNMRIAGTIFRSPGGPVTLTLLGQRRSESLPPYRNFELGALPTPGAKGPFRQVVSSAYAELRAPLIDADARLLPGLELQAAARYDHSATTFPKLSVRPEEGLGSFLKIKRSGFNYTLGARLYPLPRLMLRASVASGELYPTVENLTTRNFSLSFSFVSAFGPADPRRGGEAIGGRELVTFFGRGSPDVQSELGRTTSLGAVFNAEGQNGPRFSIDYSRVVKRRGVFPFVLTPAELLTNEQAYPERVKRAPLTELDAQRGFTGGRVTEIYLTPTNEGRTIDQMVDAEFEWRLPFLGEGQLEFYGSGTWQPRLSQLRAKSEKWLERAGAYDGPLSWRGNIGAEWRQGSFAIDANIQFFSSYRVTYADPDGRGDVIIDNPQTLRYQGSERIPSQTYVDLAVSRRLRLAGRSVSMDALDVRLGVQNVFDKRPPTVANEFDVPYSTYGDPRRRRFTLSLSAEF
jgi:outer membrane receptor protein involved in Fe transport